MNKFKMLLKSQMPFVMVMVAVIGAMLGAGCEKNNQDNIYKNDFVKQKGKQQPEPKLVNPWFDNGKEPGVYGVDYGCKGEPYDCYEEITIEETISKPLIAVLKKMYYHSNNGNEEEIVNTITDNFDLLSSIINSDILTEIVLGNMNLKVRGSIDKKCGTYIVVSEKDKVAFVFPVSLK